MKTTAKLLAPVLLALAHAAPAPAMGKLDFELLNNMVFCGVGLVEPADAKKVAGTREEACEKALQKSDNDKMKGNVLAMRSEYWRDKGNFAKADEDLNQALSLVNNVELSNGFWDYTNSVKPEDRKSYDVAIRFLGIALRASPQNAGAYNNIGFFYLQKKQYELALVNLNMAIKLDDRYANPYKHRGVLRLQRNLLDLALDDLNKAIDYKDDYLEAYQARAEVFRKKGNAADAKKDQDRVKELQAAAAKKE
ncbi:MAG TPA: hypothetical protein VHP58_02090 [Alphaproteobacteria bacterium]|nr:hypothetical protein [Alphaproteobacteria bacterium]